MLKKGIGATFAFFLLTLLLPTHSLAATTIDFSGTKDFFEELKVGESKEGDLGNKNLPNPYADAGYIKGYKIQLEKSIDPKKLELKVQSCALKLPFICVGDAFDEVIYVLNSKFQPVEGEYRYKENVDFSKFKMPDDRVLYLLVGSEKTSTSGQYTLGVTSK
ncbi:hypothetical protein HYW54_01900 [Candidatus Gottesmanbacteria bacterium]|nr:hypothetical protein [Candidatus Gottesmanbacteria bacterium]